MPSSFKYFNNKIWENKINTIETSEGLITKLLNNNSGIINGKSINT